MKKYNLEAKNILTQWVNFEKGSAGGAEAALALPLCWKEQSLKRPENQPGKRENIVLSCGQLTVLVMNAQLAREGMHICTMRLNKTRRIYCLSAQE